MQASGLCTHCRLQVTQARQKQEEHEVSLDALKRASSYSTISFTATDSTTRETGLMLKFPPCLYSCSEMVACPILDLLYMAVLRRPLLGTVISIHPTPNVNFTTPISKRLRQRDTGLRTSADPSLLVHALLDLSKFLEYPL